MKVTRRCAANLLQSARTASDMILALALAPIHTLEAVCASFGEAPLPADDECLGAADGACSLSALQHRAAVQHSRASDVHEAAPDSPLAALSAIAAAAPSAGPVDMVGCSWAWCGSGTPGGGNMVPKSQGGGREHTAQRSGRTRPGLVAPGALSAPLVAAMAKCLANDGPPRCKSPPTTTALTTQAVSGSGRLPPRRLLPNAGQISRKIVHVKTKCVQPLTPYRLWPFLASGGLGGPFRARGMLRFSPTAWSQGPRWGGPLRNPIGASSGPLWVLFVPFCASFGTFWVFPSSGLLAASSQPHRLLQASCDGPLVANSHTSFRGGGQRRLRRSTQESLCNLLSSTPDSWSPHGYSKLPRTNASRRIFAVISHASQLGQTLVNLGRLWRTPFPNFAPTSANVGQVLGNVGLNRRPDAKNTLNMYRRAGFELFAVFVGTSIQRVARRREIVQ